MRKNEILKRAKPYVDPLKGWCGEKGRKEVRDGFERVRERRGMLSRKHAYVTGIS